MKISQWLIFRLINVSTPENMALNMIVIFKLTRTTIVGLVTQLVDVMGSTWKKKVKVVVLAFGKKDEPKDIRGFCMIDDDLISSPSPLSQLSTRIKLDSTSSTGSWMEKVVHTLGSRFSSGSGKDEDRYAAIPGPSSSGQRMTNKLVKKKKKKLKRLSTTNQSSSDHMSTAAAEEEGVGGVGVGQVVLLSQKRRLQNHRDSIASLPAGMVFSPPSVGFSMFGEEDGFTTITAMRDKSLPNVHG
jgi:hypothetical protein